MNRNYTEISLNQENKMKSKNNIYFAVRKC